MTDIRETVRSENRLVAALFEQYHAPLRRYALGLTRRDDEADDLVADTFSRAMANLPLLGHLNPYQRRAWLYRVLRNRFLDLRRKDRRTDQLIRQLSRQAGAQEDLVIPLEWLTLLDDAPRRYRELLRKRYELCMTSTEIGRELGISSATVRSRLRLAIQWMRTHYVDS